MTAAALLRVDETVPIGTRVVVVRDNGDVLLTTTRSEPWRLGHGDLVVSVHGIAGGYAAWRVFVLPQEVAS